jgi:arsenate reductase
MAEGILRSLDSGLEVYSAGTKPAEQVHPMAIRVMQEIGIDISQAKPKNVSQFLKQSFDYVITVCDDADRNCPFFTGQVRNRIHIGFIDPAKARGSEEEILVVFRTVRDQIRAKFTEFYGTRIRNSAKSSELSERPPSREAAKER